MNSKKADQFFDLYHDDRSPSPAEKTQYAKVMDAAERACQKLWDALHHHRSEVEDITSAMAEVNRRCLTIRAEARERCNEGKVVRQLQ